MSSRTSVTGQATSVKSATAVNGALLQRQCACGQHTMGGKCEDCKKSQMTLHRKSDNGSVSDFVPLIVHDVLRSPGQPLDDHTRAFFEPRFGHDFSRVRVHTNGKAAESALAVNALAYTVGHDVVFDTGQYAPGTSSGRALLAHELTHVAQQAATQTTLHETLSMGEPDDLYEQEAAQMATRVLTENAKPSQSSRTSPSLHRLKSSARIQRTKGVAWGIAGGALLGGVVGGLVGGLPGAIIGGLLGAALGGLAGWLFGGKKVTVSAGCKKFCAGLDVEAEAKKADAKTGDKCKNVKFNYQVQGVAGTQAFNKAIDFSNITINCDASEPNCGGWSSKGVITLGKSACNAGVCGPLASSILHEMVHDWAGWGPPYDKKNVIVPGASHTSPDYLDEWVARYVEKECFGTNPWGLP